MKHCENCEQLRQRVAELEKQIEDAKEKTRGVVRTAMQYLEQAGAVLQCNLPVSNATDTRA